MKNLRNLLPMLFLVVILSSKGFGQIKIDDGSYKPKANNFKEVQIKPTLPAYSDLFVESMDETPYTGKPAYLNLKYNDIRPGIGSIKDEVNPVGESIFIYSDNYPKRLFLNTKDMTATVKSIPQGYYTIVGWFGKYEGSEEWRAEAVKAHLDMLENYTFDDEDNRIWALCMLSSGSSFDSRETTTWVETYHNKKSRFPQFDFIYKGETPENYTYQKFSIFVLEDQDGNLYYDYHENAESFKGYDGPCRYVSVTCYNKITELILNKEVILYPTHDFLTGEKLYDDENDIDKEDSYFFCKDIFLRDGNLVGVFENRKGEITSKLEGYKCQRFDRLGYKGVVLGGGYPKSYESLREQIIKQEKENKETLAQKQKREQEQAKEKRRKELVAKYGDKFGNLIINGKVAIGMTKEMCREAVGHYPSNQYRATTARGTSEVWVYNVANTKMILYFDDDVLYLIEDKR